MLGVALGSGLLVGSWVAWIACWGVLCVGCLLWCTLLLPPFLGKTNRQSTPSGGFQQEPRTLVLRHLLRTAIQRTLTIRFSIPRGLGHRNGANGCHLHISEAWLAPCFLDEPALRAFTRTGVGCGGTFAARAASRVRVVSHES